MARQPDPLAQYRMAIHKLGNYLYASTQPSVIENGKKVYRRKHWGRLIGNKTFEPNTAFILLSPEERSKFIYPNDWDLSKLAELKIVKQRGPAKNTRRGDRLYGDVWLLEKIADKLGLRQDLLTVFDGNVEIVNAVLTLAMFPYITQYSFNRVSRWQRIVRTPAEQELNSTFITKLTQSISTIHRDELFKLRGARLGDKTLCAVDSTSRSAYGTSLADIKWGKNKDGVQLPQTNEVVVYSLDDHAPIYYRSFPGNIPDCKTFKVILQDLEKCGFEKLTLITDRGYQSQENFEAAIQHNRSLITAVSTSRAIVSHRIDAYQTFDVYPRGMALNTEMRVYLEQFDEKIKYRTKGGIKKDADKVKLNLYFDPATRAELSLAQDIKIAETRKMLDELKGVPGAVEDISEIRKICPYHKIEFNDGVITGYITNQRKIVKERKGFGFFCLMTYKLDESASKTLEKYKIRDEQEKYFEQMKNQMRFRTQDIWSEDGKIGRLFIMFVGLVLSSYVRHIWKTTNLNEIFDSSLAVLDEMHCIRAIEDPGHKMRLTPFIGEQIKICEAFDIEVPEECAPKGYHTKRATRRSSRPN